MRKLLLHPLAKPVVFLCCLVPLVWLVYAAAADQLGANPAEALIRSTGDWTLRALCLVLAVTPLRVVTATPQLARFRRMLGLFVFFYGLLHLLSYAWFDMGLDMAVPAGTPIHAPADGVVSFAAKDLFLTGGTVLLDHGYGLDSSFLHMSRLDVKVGERVKRGDVIGLAGMTGRATGPHVHWGFNWSEVRLDPALLPRTSE